MSGFWGRRNLLEFIQLYKKLECLWRTRDKDYHNRDAKEAAYQKLLQILIKSEPDSNTLSVTRKINNFRTSFRKEHKKVLKSIREGGPVYKPKLWYYNELQFLLEQKKGSDNDENSEDEKDDSETRVKHEESMSSTFSDPTCYPEGDSLLDQSKGQSFVDPAIEDAEFTPSLEPSTYRAQCAPTTYAHATPYPSFTTPVCSGEDKNPGMSLGQATPDLQLSSVGTLKEDEHDVFGKHVAHRLRRLPPAQVKFALKLISDVLFEADLASLNRNCKIFGTRDPGLM